MMKTVIFDMDGVLIDSEVIYLKSLQKYLKTLDIEEDLQTLSCLVGMNAKDTTKYLSFASYSNKGINGKTGFIF